MQNKLNSYPIFITSLSLSQNYERAATPSRKARLFYKLKKYQWQDPPQDSAPVQFFNTTSLHGLRYLGQRKRHICERLFWLASFTLATMFSTVLIWKMWNAYATMPIITVFNPEETKLNQIPFPSVTICNANKIRKKIWEDYRKKANEALQGKFSNDTMLKLFASVYEVYHICHATGTFTDNFRNMTGSAPELIKPMTETFVQYIKYMDTLGTLAEASQSCEDMILYCLWLDSVKNCSELFQRVETDYGSCCTFNMIPLSLLYAKRNDTRENPERLKAWKEANINYDNILLGKSNLNRKYPLRQFFPGRSAGLSILLDPQMDQYFCTNTDSQGFVLGLNLPIDYPRVKDHGIAVRTSTESFISVHPEITMSDHSTKSFSLEKRRCYFEGEMKLKHYTKYTSSNCMDECLARLTMEGCGCVRYYMPHTEDEKVCRPWNYTCTDNVREQILEGALGSACNECLPACTDIRYISETTALRLWEKRILEMLEQNIDKHPNYEDLTTRAKDMAIVHVYFNVDSVFPRLRKERTSIVDLISAAGGLLGLCMGFSVLSLLEILYHGTLRVFCNIYQKRYQNNITSCDDAGYIDERNQFLSKIPRFDENYGIYKKNKMFKLNDGYPSVLDAEFRRTYFATLK